MTNIGQFDKAETVGRPSIDAVFAAIQKIGTATATQIANELHASNQKCVETKLDDLSRLGVIQASADMPIKYAAINANSAFPLLADSIISESIVHLELLAKLSRQIPHSGTLVEKPHQQDMADLFEFIRDKNEAVRRLHELTAISQKNIDSYMPYVPSSKQLSDSLKSDIELENRGIKLRILYSPRAETDFDVIDYCSRFTPPNRARLSCSFPSSTRFMIIDKSACYISQIDNAEPFTAIISKHPVMISFIATLFDYMWQYSIPFVRESNAENQLTAKESAVIRMLAEGKTHFAISKELNIAPRTVDRILERLELKVGASSRFRLAIEAQKRGWLD